MIRKETARVLSRNPLAQGIYALTLQVGFATEVKAGQFISLFSKDEGHLMPRPISICSVDKDTLTIVYRVVGYGTEELSKLMPEDTVEVMGPLGNGFPLAAAQGKKVLLVGGGIGIPPMFNCGKALLQDRIEGTEVTFAVGYRSSDTYLLEELQSLAPVVISSDDGSIGTRGTVLDAIREGGVEADVIFACGPKPMLRALADYAAEKDIPCFVSMEEKMACGVGVCLGCVTKTTKVDHHSMVKNARICKDGPVFDAREVDLS